MLRRIAAALLVIALCAPVGPAAAQEAPDYKAWEQAAEAVQTVLDQEAVTDQELSDARTRMVAWREAFMAAEGLNGDAIQTLRDQITSLGDPPAEGATEEEGIAKRRKELEAALGKLQAPVIAASEAETQADSLIRAIDREIRTRKADRLLRLSPAPANPVNWPAAVSLMAWMGDWLYDETKDQLDDPSSFDDLRDNAPLIAGLSLVALVALLRGGRWMSRLTEWLPARISMRGRNLIATLVSLGQVAVPFVGALLLATALDISGLFGPIVTSFLALFPILVLTIYAARWLGRRAFPAQAGEESALDLAPEVRAEGRIHALAMGIALALAQVLVDWIAPRAESYLGAGNRLGAERAAEVAERADAAVAVLHVPLFLFAALTLFRTGQLLRTKVAARTGDADAQFRTAFLSWVGTFAIAVALVAPLLGLVGYVSAANALIWPTMVSLGLIALIAVLQDLLAEVYIVATRGEGSKKGEALVPVLAGFLLILAALPLFALIWGARFEDLTEIWTSVRNGFSIGGVRISPAVFFTLIIVFAIGFTLTRVLQGALRSSILPKTTIDKGGQNAIVSGLGYLGLFLAAIFAISSAGIDLSSLAIVAGALSVGIGFGLQNIVSNFVSGIILLIERPISEGDWIEVGGQMGTVKAISVRSTRIETPDRTEVIVPNADLVSGQVTNWTRGNKTGRAVIPVGVAYGSDTRRIEAMLREMAENHPLVMMAPEPQVVFVSFGPDSLNFEIRVIIADILFRPKVISDINHEIARRFADEEIEIPFAQRDVWLRNPEVLRPEAAAPRPAWLQTPPPEAQIRGTGAAGRTPAAPPAGPPAAAQGAPDDEDEAPAGPTDGYGGRA